MYLDNKAIRYVTTLSVKLQEKFLILSVLFSSLALFPNFIFNFLTLVMQFLFTSAVFSRIMALTRLAHG